MHHLDANCESVRVRPGCRNMPPDLPRIPVKTPHSDVPTFLPPPPSSPRLYPLPRPHARGSNDSFSFRRRTRPTFTHSARQAPAQPCRTRTSVPSRLCIYILTRLHIHMYIYSIKVVCTHVHIFYQGSLYICVLYLSTNSKLQSYTP